MKVVFDGDTLADLTATPKIHGLIEQFGGQSVVDTQKVYGGANEVDFPRGNVGGDFVFTAACTYASYAAAVAAFSAAYALLDIQATLVITPFQSISSTLTMANAICRSVQRVEWYGVRLKIRYTFKISTVTSP